MTITIPFGMQTMTVAGEATIATNGSLSMTSYSGTKVLTATNAKLGTMTGSSWNQGPTQ